MVAFQKKNMVMKIYPIFKRFCDITLALLLIVHLSSIWLLLLILQLINLPITQILFFQSRPGLHGKIFTLYKLKTLENGIIISPYAHWLRKTGLDEFPQLFNILIGQMSFVGPRPLLPSYLPLYTAHQFTRHNVPPGITGWSQVHGRNATTWNNRFELDIWYAKNQSFLIDIQIIFLTFKQLFYGQNTKEMPIWKGN